MRLDLMQNGQKLELWAGFECSVVRIANSFRNQIDETGHGTRLDDIAAVRSLGIKKLRYPVLWETVAPDKPDSCDWTESDKRLGELARSGMEPIVGLLHHGSGPSYTNLLDRNFSTLFARYAQRVAARYPWVTHFTPINEPLTTARFSCLYGHWYPHKSNTRDFLHALVNQCKAIVLAMRAIRTITPHAQLIQTEDLGRVFSTPALSYQADFENQRRWLSLDLLFGRVGRDHPWYDVFIANGVEQSDLALLLEGDCRPDIVGINHYVTSDRYLDERVHNYSSECSGGNGRHRYADVEAVRIDLPADALGMKARLSEAWKRYHLPVVATEVHLGCTREDQVRWLVDAWNAAQELRAEGQDIRAITVWSLVGAMDWSSLLVSRREHYESGVFDIRGGRRRRTALANAARSLAKRGSYSHPVLNGTGWWRRNDRYFAGPSAGEQSECTEQARILIAGSSGCALTALFTEICRARGLACSLLFADELGANDAADQIARMQGWALINLDQSLMRPWGGTDDPPRASLSRAKHLAQAATHARIPLVHLSSHLVFDGKLGRPYTEKDSVSPDDEAGWNLVLAERAILGRCTDALVIRAGPLFGLADDHSLAFEAESEPADLTICPTFAPDLFNGMLDLLIDGEHGIWHLANRGEMSSADFERLLLRRRPTADLPGVADSTSPPLSNFALRSAKGDILPTLHDAVVRLFGSDGGTAAEEPMQVAAE